MVLGSEHEPSYLGFSSADSQDVKLSLRCLGWPQKSLSFQAIDSKPVSTKIGWTHLLFIESLTGEDRDWRRWGGSLVWSGENRPCGQTV